jgi:hypothetical protein
MGATSYAFVKKVIPGKCGYPGLELSVTLRAFAINSVPMRIPIWSIEIVR